MVGTKDYFGELELLNKPDPFEAVALVNFFSFFNFIS